MAELNIHRAYQLKPSQVALGFQLVCLISIILLVSSLLNNWICIGLFLVASLSLKIFRLKQKVVQLEYLDQTEWSLKFADCDQIQRFKIRQMLDHTLYITILFEDKNIKNLNIWIDQLPQKQWKSLKTRAKLN